MTWPTSLRSGRARQNPDRDADLADTQRARRRLTVTDQSDGMTRVEALLDPEPGAIVRSTLDGIMNQSAFDGTRRSRNQRCADAFTQLCSAASKGNLAGGRYHGATNDNNLVLLCHRHYQLSHHRGWKITGTGTEREVHNPDGSIEISRPPEGPPPGSPPPGSSPPAATPPRAGTTGQEPPGNNAPAPKTAPDDTGTTPWNLEPEQLTLA